MDKIRIAGLLARIAGEHRIMVDEPMKRHTSFKLGGPADILAAPESVEALVEVYRVCREEKVPVFIMGNGTNLVVRDGGIRGVVLKIFDNLSRCEVAGERILAEAGALMARLSKLALEHGLSGLEFAEGIPGTLGGAVVMNAGAYIGEMKQVVVRTEYLDPEGNLQVIEGDQHRFGKRTSYFQEAGGIILRSELQLHPGDRSQIKGLMDDFNRQRREKQPLELPSAGSVFKRPEGHFAGKLIQDCGLRGCRVGGAEVSNKHCGFIVNVDQAKAADVTDLIAHIRQAVKERFEVELETEVRIVGEE